MLNKKSNYFLVLIFSFKDFCAEYDYQSTLYNIWENISLKDRIIHEYKTKIWIKYSVILSSWKAFSF